jgi:hypothetical protein
MFCVILLQHLRIRPQALFQFWNTYVPVSTFGTTPWGRQPRKALLTQDSTSQKSADAYTCFEWDSSPRSLCSSNEDSRLVSESKALIEHATSKFLPERSRETQQYLHYHTWGQEMAKVKDKVVPLRSTEALWVTGGIDPTLSWPRY